MLSLIASHARVKAPWVHPCGLLDAKEFVVAADRLVTPRGQVVPGAGAGSGCGLPGWVACMCLGDLAGAHAWDSKQALHHGAPHRMWHTECSSASLASPWLAPTPPIPPCCARRAVHVRGGLIASVAYGMAGTDRRALATRLLAGRALPLLDYGDAVLAPGLVDLHVHMNEPGREHWEGACGGGGAGWGAGVMRCWVGAAHVPPHPACPAAHP